MSIIVIFITYHLFKITSKTIKIVKKQRIMNNLIEAIKYTSIKDKVIRVGLSHTYRFKY